MQRGAHFPCAGSSPEGPTHLKPARFVEPQRPSLLKIGFEIGRKILGCYKANEKLREGVGHSCPQLLIESFLTAQKSIL